jgi:hypothetical protein
VQDSRHQLKNEELEKQAQEILADPAWSEGHPPGKLWAYMLDLIYSGHADLVRQFFETAWPAGVEGQELFWNEFHAQLATSPYWEDLGRFPAAPPAVGWQSLPPPECEILAGMLAEQLTVSNTITTSTFVSDPNTALLDNTACQITTAATNQILEVAHGLELADKVQAALAPLGWGEEVYSRMGSGGFASVVANYHNGEALCRLED